MLASLQGSLQANMEGHLLMLLKLAVLVKLELKYVKQHSLGKLLDWESL